MSPSIEWVSGDDSESEGPRDGQLAVLADHSTEGQGVCKCLAGKVGNRGPRDPL